MGEFMQYLPGLCFCCVITSRARLRPCLHLSGQGPTLDPEIWVCTKPNALCYCQEMWQARILQRQARILQHPGTSSTHCWEAALQDSASWMRYPLTTFLKTTLAVSLTKLPGLFFWSARMQGAAPHPLPALPGCPCNTGAAWVQYVCNTGAAHAQSRVSIGHCSPQGDDAPTFLQAEPSPFQAANMWLNQRYNRGGPHYTPWHS